MAVIRDGKLVLSGEELDIIIGKKVIKLLLTSRGLNEYGLLLLYTPQKTSNPMDKSLTDISLPVPEEVLSKFPEGSSFGKVSKVFHPTTKKPIGIVLCP